MKKPSSVTRVTRVTRVNAQARTPAVVAAIDSESEHSDTSDDDDEPVEEFDEQQSDMEPDEAIDENADEDAPRARKIRNALAVDEDSDADEDFNKHDTNEIADWDDSTSVVDEPLESIRIVKIVNPLDRITSEMLTGKECGRIIGDRARLLDNGAVPYIKNPLDFASSLHIAREELIQKRIPFAIVRSIGNHRVEYWRLFEMSLPQDIPTFD